MKILVSSMTFEPDHSGISLYSTDFALYASEQGHEVTVVTAFSWYPKWMKKKEDEGKLFRTDFYGKIKILRGYLYVPKRITAFTRIIQEITFLIFAFCNFFRAGNHDVIVLFTTPINLGLVGVFFKKYWGARLVNNVQDLQLNAAESLNMLSKSPVVRIMNRIETYSYKNSDLVTSISEAMVDLIRKKGISEDNLYLWPNWINVNEASCKGEEGAFRRKFPKYSHKKIVGYAGNIGVKQGLSALIDLGKRFESNESLVFLIIGQGGDLDNLKRYAKETQSSNVDFIDFLSQEDYFDFLSDADVIFLSQKKDSGDAYFPSKLLGIMAKKKLIFVAAGAESEIYKVLEKNNLGLLSDIDDMEQMTEALNRYVSGTNIADSYKASAFAYVKKFDREIVLKKFLNKLSLL